jgi:rRNA-processing protein FCF1
MGKTRPRAVVLDAGAIIAFERADARMRALLREALRTNVPIVVPAGVLGQVWRNPAQQVPLRALLTEPTTTVPALDQPLAEAAGVLCGRAGTADVIDAAVVLLARQHNAVVVTSDVKDLTRLDPQLTLVSI